MKTTAQHLPVIKLRTILMQSLVTDAMTAARRTQIAAQTALKSGVLRPTLTFFVVVRRLKPTFY